jgi:hypothetical protein
LTRDGVLVEKHVPVPFCPPDIPPGLDLESNQVLCGERPAVNI